jgi:tetratricopeptide (TPR) repeat protein
VEDQPRLYVQLGSTLRNLSSLPESLSVLQEGLKYFPKYKALRAFLALTEYSMGNHAQAIQSLMQVTLEEATDSSLIDYSRALGWYAGELTT